MTDAQAVALADHPPGAENALRGIPPGDERTPPGEAIPGAPRWMTMAETAVYLNKPYNTLMQHWRKWGLTSYKIGRDRQFRQDEVDAWVLNQREGQISA
jgi:excisionase family DNA binding protein